jgi:hypothetical protein
MVDNRQLIKTSSNDVCGDSPSTRQLYPSRPTPLWLSKEGKLRGLMNLAAVATSDERDPNSVDYPLEGAWPSSSLARALDPPPKGVSSRRGGVPGPVPPLPFSPGGRPIGKPGPLGPLRSGGPPVPPPGVAPLPSVRLRRTELIGSRPAEIAVVRRRVLDAPYVGTSACRRAGVGFYKHLCRSWGSLERSEGGAFVASSMILITPLKNAGFLAQNRASSKKRRIL